MDVQAVINDMKYMIPKLKNTVTKDTPIYKLLNNKDTHRRIVELALALGEDRLLRHLNSLSLEKDFIFDWEQGYCIKCFSTITDSDFFKEIYMELVEKETFILDMLASNSIKVHIELTHEQLQGEYKYRFYMPMIKFETEQKMIEVTHGMIRYIRPEGYKELKFEQ